MWWQLSYCCDKRGQFFWSWNDYGKQNINYSNKIKNKLGLNKKLKFQVGSVYKTKLKSNSFDIAIQNGVFHHLDHPTRAYKELYRVLKKGGYAWFYTDGGGGIEI